MFGRNTTFKLLDKPEKRLIRSFALLEKFFGRHAFRTANEDVEISVANMSENEDFKLRIIAAVLDFDSIGELLKAGNRNRNIVLVHHRMSGARVLRTLSHDTFGNAFTDLPKRFRFSRRLCFYAIKNR